MNSLRAGFEGNKFFGGRTWATPATCGIHDLQKAISSGVSRIALAVLTRRDDYYAAKLCFAILLPTVLVAMLA